MKINKFIGRTFVLAGLLVVAAAPANAKARIVSLKGTVQIFFGGKWQTATTATQLESGTPIQTAYNSNALIMFSSGGQMALKPNTKIILNDLPVNPGSSRDIFLEHGQVSAFVKKGDAASANQFRIRTPTITAGVRGSLLAASQTGKTGKAVAVHSAAYYAKSLHSTGIEMLKREMMKMRAQISANARKQAELKKMAANPVRYHLTAAQIQKQMAALATENKQLQLALAVGNKELISLDRLVMKEMANANQIAQLERMAANPKKYGTTAAAIAAKINALTTENQKLETQVAAEQSRISALDTTFAQLLSGAPAATALATQTGIQSLSQGDTAKVLGTTVVSPVTVVKQDTRPATLVTVGQTGTEAAFSNQNNDTKVGLGSDFQQLYNQVNTVTQPTSTGLPTLKKF